jgi:glycosyltransferase involved in cell wall biosynthesis
MVNTPGYAAMISESLHVGAASNKMIMVVRAMRDASAKAYLVTMPVLGHKAHNKHVAAAILKYREGPQIFLPVVANRYVRKVYALFGFGWFCITKVGKKDRVILYNHAVEYLLGLLILTLRGNRPILDVEDAVREDEPGWYSIFSRFLFYLYFRLTRQRKLIVSEVLAGNLGLRQYCVVYGATRTDTELCKHIYRVPWGGVDTYEPLKIHYGGSLNVDSGINLFCGAVDLLVGSLRRDVCQVQFIITGFGSEEQIEALKKRCAGSGVRIILHLHSSPDEYLDQFCRCHAALSLKLPESEMAMTTFPSKVVEITSQGLLLISTKASDVPLLFDSDNAVLLSEASPTALASAIMSVLADPTGMQQIANCGKARAVELFAARDVGKRVVDFVLNGDA